MKEPSKEAMEAALAWMVGAVTTVEDEQLQLARHLDAFAEKRVEEVLAMLAPYAYHHPMCPKNQDHRCTCGMSEARIKLWGSDKRPADEPRVTPHQDAPKQRRVRGAK